MVVNMSHSFDTLKSDTASRSSSETSYLASDLVVTKDEGQLSADTSERKHQTSYFAGIKLPGLIYPKSMYVGHETPLPVSKERLVLKDILVSVLAANP